MGQTSGSYGPPIDVGMATLEGGIYFYDLLVADGPAADVVVTAYSSTGLEIDFSGEMFLPGVFPALLPAILYILEGDE